MDKWVLRLNNTNIKKQGSTRPEEQMVRVSQCIHESLTASPRLRAYFWGIAGASSPMVGNNCAEEPVSQVGLSVCLYTNAGSHLHSSPPSSHKHPRCQPQQTAVHQSCWALSYILTQFFLPMMAPAFSPGQTPSYPLIPSYISSSVFTR